MYPLLFSYSLLRPCSLGMAMSILHFLYFAGPYPWNVGNVWFTFLLCVIALCIMYVYIYIYIYICLHVCGWLCTLYDGLSWLHEWTSLFMRAIDPIVWVCTQGDCRRCIFMLYCVHNHYGVIILIHVTKWHRLSCVCDTHQHAWHFGGLRLTTVRAYRYVPCTQTQNPTDAP